MAEGEKQLYRRTVRGFEPANPFADEWARSCKIGDVVELKGSKPRNPAFHALWWALLQDMAASWPFLQTALANLEMVLAKSPKFNLGEANKTLRW